MRERSDRFFGPGLCDRPQYPDVREMLNTSLRGAALPQSSDPRPEAVTAHVARLQRLARTLLL